MSQTRLRRRGSFLQLVHPVIWSVIIFFSIPGDLPASTTPDLEEMSFQEILENQQVAQGLKREKDLKILEDAKVSLINGNIKRSKGLLLKLNPISDVTRGIKDRYLAIVYFIEGNYQKSLEILDGPLFTDPKLYKKICTLKLTNKVILNQMSKIRQEFDFCSSINNKYSPTGMAWLEFLISVRLEDDLVSTGRHLNHINRFTQSIEMVRLWLKMGMYLNQEHLIIPRLKHLTVDAFQSKKIRELIGLIYYRMGEDENVMKFIEDLNTANAENIQGNIKLEKKQYELAFGHFQLALKKKQNSVNAIERSLTLAWILSKFEEGLEITKKINAKDGSLNKKRTLMAAFLTRSGEHQKAIDELYPVFQSYQGKQPADVSELLAYNSLLTRNYLDAKRFSDVLCKKRSGAHCYLLFQLGLWEDLGKTILRDNPIFADNEINLEKLKEKVADAPLSEEIFVDQRDIEELDEAQAQSMIR